MSLSFYPTFALGGILSLMLIAAHVPDAQTLEPYRGIGCVMLPVYDHTFLAKYGTHAKAIEAIRNYIDAMNIHLYPLQFIHPITGKMYTNFAHLISEHGILFVKDIFDRTIVTEELAQEILNMRLSWYAAQVPCLVMLFTDAVVEYERVELNGMSFPNGICQPPHVKKICEENDSLSDCFKYLNIALVSVADCSGDSTEADPFCVATGLHETFHPLMTRPFHDTSNTSSPDYHPQHVMNDPRKKETFQEIVISNKTKSEGALGFANKMSQNKTNCFVPIPRDWTLSTSTESPTSSTVSSSPKQFTITLPPNLSTEAIQTFVKKASSESTHFIVRHSYSIIIGGSVVFCLCVLFMVIKPLKSRFFPGSSEQAQVPTEQSSALIRANSPTSTNGSTNIGLFYYVLSFWMTLMGVGYVGARFRHEIGRQYRQIHTV